MSVYVCVCVCVCVHVCVRVCACSHVPAAHPVVLCVLQVCECAHLFQQYCVFCMYMGVCACVHECVRVCMRASVCSSLSVCTCECVCVCVCIHSPVPAAHPAAFSAPWPPSCGWQRHQEALGVGRLATRGGGLGAARMAGADPGPGDAAGVWSWGVTEVAVLLLPGRLAWHLGVKPSRGYRHPHDPFLCPFSHVHF